MSVHITSAIWHSAHAKGPALLVLLKIGDQANDDGYTWLRQETIAGDPHDDDTERRAPGTRLSLRTVQRHIQTLRNLGDLHIIERQGRSHVYRVTPGGMPLVRGKPDPDYDPADPESVWNPGDLEALPRNIAAAVADYDPKAGEVPDPGDQAGSAVSQTTDPRQFDGGDPRQPDTPPPSEMTPHPRQSDGTPLSDWRPSHKGTITEPLREPLPPESEAWEIVNPANLTAAADCHVNGCDRGQHDGPHHDPWFDAVGIALRETVPTDSTAGLWARIARHAENTGRAPNDILRAAAVIVAEWGPAKLTAGSLAKHFEWALSPNRQITDTQIADFAADTTRAHRIAAAVEAGRRALMKGGTE